MGKSLQYCPEQLKMTPEQQTDMLNIVIKNVKSVFLMAILGLQ